MSFLPQREGDTRKDPHSRGGSGGSGSLRVGRYGSLGAQVRGRRAIPIASLPFQNAPSTRIPRTSEKSIRGVINPPDASRQKATFSCSVSGPRRFRETLPALRAPASRRRPAGRRRWRPRVDPSSLRGRRGGRRDAGPDGREVAERIGPLTFVTDGSFSGWPRRRPREAPSPDAARRCCAWLAASCRRRRRAGRSTAGKVCRPRPSPSWDS